jgi:hypothetical protein
MLKPQCEHYHFDFKPQILLRILILFLFAWFQSPYLPASAQESSEWPSPINFSKQRDSFSWAPVLTCDQYHNTHAFWVEQEPQRNVIFTSSYLGDHWSEPNDILLTNGVRFLNNSISRDNYAYLTWVNYVKGSLFFAKTHLAHVSDPRKWVGPDIITDDVDSVGMAVDSKNTIHIVYSTSDEDNLKHETFYIYSSDHGQNWSPPTSIWKYPATVPSAIDLVLKIDPQDHLYIAYTLGSFTYGKYREVGLLRSLDTGRTWIIPNKIISSTTPPGVAVANVYAFGNNEVHLTYDIPERMHMWSKDGGVTWSKPELIVDLGAAFGGYNQLAKDSLGKIHVITAVADGVYHAEWDGMKWGIAEKIDDRYIDPHNQQMSICNGQKLDILYDDRTGENEVWYITKDLGTPKLTQSAVPTPIPTPLPTSNSVSAEITTAPTSTITNLNRNTSPGEDNPFSPILISIAPVFLVFFLAYIFIQFRKRG